MANAAQFDTTFYLSTYPDVAVAISRGQFASAEQHYNQFGRFESRNPNAYFDTTFYLTQNADVAANRGNPFEHFVNFGSKEGRFGNANEDSAIDANNNNRADDFDAATYLAANSDVANAVGEGKAFATAYQHYILFGQFESRPGAQLTNGTALSGPFANGGTTTSPAVNLTTNIDTLTGTSGNDTFRGDNTTVQAGDTINGGAGRDTFSYTDSSNGTNPTLTTNSVEVISIRNIATSVTTGNATETATASFVDVTTGNTVVIGGLTVTATGGTATAADIATAFRTGVTTNNAAVTGSVSGYTVSGFVGATSVLFTSTTPNANVTPNLSNSGTGSATVSVSNGSAGTTVQATTSVDASTFVGATDFSSDNSTGGVTFNNLVQGQTVSLNGNGLANTGGLTANFATAATAAVINLSNTVGSAAIDLNGTGLTTATINSTVGANSVGTFDVAGAKTINLNASTAFTTSGITTATAASTLNITGAGKVALGTLDADITTVNAAASSGGVTLAATAAGDVKFTGSSVSDSIAFGAQFTSADVVDGGAGRDTVSLNGDNFVTGTDALKGLNALTGVEVLEFTGSTGVTISGGTAATSFTNSTVDQLIFNTADAGTDTVELAGARLYSFGADNTGAATFNSAIGQNTLNLSFIGADTAGGSAAEVSTLTSTGATTINIASTGATTAANIITTLTAAANATVNITGSHALTIGGSTNGVVIDGSTATGKLSITASGVADIIKGGSAADTIIAGVGADTITGNGGNDTFKFNHGDSVVATSAFDTITDLNLGSNVVGGQVDILSFQNTGATAATVVSLTTAQQTDVTGAASFAAAVNAVAAIATADGATTQFTYGSDTYIFHSGAAGSATFDANNDHIVKVTGVTGTLDASDIATFS